MEQSIPVSLPAVQPPRFGAGFGLRAGAQIVDLIIHNVIGLAISFIVEISNRDLRNCNRNTFVCFGEQVAGYNAIRLRPCSSWLCFLSCHLRRNAWRNIR